MRIRTLSIIVSVAGWMPLAGAQLSVPPAANFLAPKVDSKRAALLLPPTAPARRIVLAAPTAEERAAGMTPKSTGKDGAASTYREKSALQIGFGRPLPAADRNIALADLDWQAVDGATRAARLTVTSASAAAIRLGMQLTGASPDLRIRFVGSAGNAQAFGPYTTADVNRHAVFWSPVLDGETAIVELSLPASSVPQGVLEIGELSHLLAAGTDLSSDAALKLLPVGGAASCEFDVACVATDLQTQAQSGVQATARYAVTYGASTYLCTGTLVNDGITSNAPYFYTANHCLDNTMSPGDTRGLSAAAAATINTYWFFEAATCGSREQPPYVQLAGGAALLGRSLDNDWTLLRLNSTPPSGVTFAGWNANSQVATNANVIGIHHPRGDLKKLSQGNATGYQNYNTGNFIVVRWNSGVTEAGSSGSGVFTFNSETDTYELRGGLWGGASSCSSPRSSDYYSRIELAYPLVQEYLAPAAVRAGGKVVVIEFYNASLNDYFITADPAEIADLDSGAHPGWMRTGFRFLAYGDAASAPSGAVPVCRFYLRPLYGDSHFYSADAAECAATLAKFGDSWVYESAAVFYITLPNQTNGSCPSGTTSIYRFYSPFNAIHHRYTAEVGVRNDLLSKGQWRAEGYGPAGNQVVMCAPSA